MTIQPWYLYIVECADGTYYTGISIDVTRRVKVHNNGRGSRYTASRLPVVLRATWRFPGRRQAMQAELALKRQGRPAKQRLIASGQGFGQGERVKVERENGLENPANGC